MKVLTVRNVHEALPVALQHLADHGVSRDSRYGRVRQAPWPVTTVYERPWERVLFWQERDANPFFHLYESLWMLAGRNDLAPLLRYVKTFGEFSDDGKTVHDAYGHRWRHHFDLNQVNIIIETLENNRDDRRCVLQMWDPKTDLGRKGKAFPCNTTATFQVNTVGQLELTVFCRSNDIIMGAYGANAVHFSVLHEYVARMAEIEMGPYRQVSINWHAYDKTCTEKIRNIRDAAPRWQPYANNSLTVKPLPLFTDVQKKFAMSMIMGLLSDADAGDTKRMCSGVDWIDVIGAVLAAHNVYKQNPDSPHKALSCLDKVHLDDKWDWIVAARDWLNRRIERRQAARA